MDFLVLTFSNTLKSAKASCLLDEQDKVHHRNFSQIWIEKTTETEQQQANQMLQSMGDMGQVVVSSVTISKPKIKKESTHVESLPENKEEPIPE